MTLLIPAQPMDFPTLAALMAGPEPIRFIAGGTDLLISTRQLPPAGRLVDLSSVAGLAGVECSDTEIRIGGATTVAALQVHAELTVRCSALVQAACDCGSVQIRNRATIGGNIATAAPAADLVPVLVLANARLKLMMPGATMVEVAFADFRPAPGVLIAEVILPEANLLPRSAFAKLGLRRDLTIARINLAAMAEFSDGRFGALRLVAGALGPRPIRLRHAEAALANRPLDPAALREFVESLGAEVDAAIAGRGSRDWKRWAIRGLGCDLIARLCGLSSRDPIFDETL